MSGLHLKEYSNADLEIPSVKIIRRDSIPEINRIFENGEERNLGIVKNLRSIKEINQFIPASGRFSPSWVHLDKDERLEVHTHPIDSFYIITEGEGVVLGDLEGEIVKAGDVILIPRHCKHGFIGGGSEGYWGLSIQFERGLYEKPDEPLVSFDRYAENKKLKGIRLSNDVFLERFKKNKIFKLLSSGITNPSKSSVFLDYMQVLSDHFQRMMLLRSAISEDMQYTKVFWQHLVEEFGHNEKLRESRSGYQVRFDPVFDALCVWFTNKMNSLDNVEKFFLVHCVIEAAAAEFYKTAYPLFSATMIHHFEEHMELDQKHASDDWNFPSDLGEKAIQNIMTLQREAWGVIEAQYARLAELVEGQE